MRTQIEVELGPGESIQIAGNKLTLLKTEKDEAYFELDRGAPGDDDSPVCCLTADQQDPEEL